MSELPRWHEIQAEIVRLQNKIEEIERVRITPLEKEVDRLRKPGDKKIEAETP